MEISIDGDVRWQSSSRGQVSGARTTQSASGVAPFLLAKSCYWAAATTYSTPPTHSMLAPEPPPHRLAQALFFWGIEPPRQFFRLLLQTIVTTSLPFVPPQAPSTSSLPPLPPSARWFVISAYY